MSKINQLLYRPGMGKITVAAAIKTVVPSVEPISIEPLEKKASSVFDFSTEELGYFMFNGKKVPIIFPR